MWCSETEKHRLPLGMGRAICPSSDCPSFKMSQSTVVEEGGTLEHLWSSLEPDSTYYELPTNSQRGEHPVASTSTPGNHRNCAEVSMDVYHIRDMNDNVMVGA
ncbi:hypothetical protein AMECASPLE_008477 [Ameca splendens]|uniref:Uncharacterized protein n=1 Tax=Ameca splendens TaxID=208324 RepID=A0ABV0Y0E7_9TELE